MGAWFGNPYVFAGFYLDIFLDVELVDV